LANLSRTGAIARHLGENVALDTRRLSDNSLLLRSAANSDRALERPKYPQRSINCASGNFALSALSTKFSLDLTRNTILGQPPRAEWRDIQEDEKKRTI
jgi:hypothetical protein